MNKPVPAEDIILAVPKCDNCGKTMVPARGGANSDRTDGTELRVYICDCGARTSFLWRPKTRR